MSFNYFESLSHVATYSKFRPIPPPALFQRIVQFLQDESPRLQTAVDVGCGSGQSTCLLSPYFKQVVGVDPSESIINSARKLYNIDNVSFKVSNAEELAFNPKSVDLVTVCQAIHWFDKPKFYKEVENILADKGVLAVYGYGLPEPRTESVDSTELKFLVRKYYDDILGEYVYSNSRQVYLGKYTDPEFNNVPFVENQKMIREDGFSINAEVTLADITGYLRSWSAYQHYVQKCGEDAGERIMKQFEEEFVKLSGGDKSEKVYVTYNYFLLLGRKANN